MFEQLKSGEAQFETNRNAGFTTVLTVSRDGVFNGQSAVINLAGDSVSEMIVRAPFAEHITLTTLRGGTYPTSLMGTFSALRQMLLDAQRFQEIKKIYEKNPRGLKRPEADLSLEALVPVLNREMPIVFNANSEIEIIRVLDLAREFNLRAIVAGGQEAWKVANELKQNNISVIYTNIYNLPVRDDDPYDYLFETPTKLQKAGVKFCIATGDQGAEVRDLPYHAGLAGAYGLPKDEALKAVTLYPAQILGIADRLGSIETGKIANIVVADGDILEPRTNIKHLFINGRMIPLTSRHTNLFEQFRDRK